MECLLAFLLRLLQCNGCDGMQDISLEEFSPFLIVVVEQYNQNGIVVTRIIFFKKKARFTINICSTNITEIFLRNISKASDIFPNILKYFEISNVIKLKCLEMFQRLFEN